MTTNDHGKKIREIWYAGDGNALDTCVKTNEIQKLELSAMHHGDRDEFWVIVKRGGVEVERFNVRQLSNIIWA